MCVDKVEGLSDSVKRTYRKLAEEHGKPQGGYSRFLDLRKTPQSLPALLYCGGIHNGVNKLQFTDAARLGLSGVRKITEEVLGDSRFVRIARLDLCLDLWDVPAHDLAVYCRIARAQNCSVEKSRSGVTFYLRRSKQHVVLVYDRLARLRAIRRSPLDYPPGIEHVARLEVQLRGRALPFRNFRDIERYSDIDVLSGISFWKCGFKAEGLTTTAALAAEALLSMINDYGLQVTSKRFSPQTWMYLQNKFLIPASPSSIPNLKRLMRKSIREWMKDHIRYPRY